MSEARTPLLGASANPFDEDKDAYVFYTPGSRSGEARAPAPAPSGGAGPLWTVCPFILANEFCERLAYYGLATNLVTYLGTDAKHGVMQLESDAAAAAQQAWSGTCYLTAIIGAVVADAALGRCGVTARAG
jgi:peptide/histidine transporter 3/4